MLLHFIYKKYYLQSSNSSNKSHILVIPRLTLSRLFANETLTKLFNIFNSFALLLPI